MLVRADALLLDRERADEPKSQQALAHRSKMSLKPKSGERAFRLTIIEGQLSWRASGSRSTSSRPSIISFLSAIESNRREPSCVHITLSRSSQLSWSWSA
jgi:hypothetical protein